MFSDDLSSFRLGSILVQECLISRQQLTTALAEQKQTGEKLGAILVQKQWVTPAQVEKALKQQNWYRHLQKFCQKQLGINLDFSLFNRLLSSDRASGNIKVGEILVTKGYISPFQLQHALAIQEASGGKLGEILVREQLLSRQDLSDALNEQKVLKFVAALLAIEMSVFGMGMEAVRAEKQDSSQVRVRFEGYVPEQVEVDVNPNFKSSQTPSPEKDNLLKVRDNGSDKDQVAEVQYDRENDQYTVTPR